LFVGCGGGGSSVTFDDPAIIENKDFYRVKLVDLGEKYMKEVFDGNDTLHESTYLINDELDSNRTIPYEIKSSLVYITDNNVTIRCSVVDSNLSVEFYCLEEGQSGSLSLYTTRWKTLEDATLNPE
jgi:hypothetical protein